MIDSHCHLTDDRLGTQLDDVLARAAAAGVSRVVTIATDPADARACLAVCDRRPGEVRCTVGIHPNYSQHATVADVEPLRELQRSAHVLALGEMGLDYFHQHAARDHQAAVFRAQLALAAEVGKPVVIHSRESIDDCLAILREFPPIPAVFHCFTGTPDEARRIVEAGYLVGFTGAVTYRKNDALREAARLVPDERLLVETDAPYLSPEPVRKVKTNEPAFVVYVAETLARVRGVTVGEIDRLTTANAERFFRWGAST
jgi:TatD DNase family protein